MRERLLGTVFERVNRCVSGADPAELLEPEAAAEIDRLIELHEAAPNDPEIAFVLGWARWARAEAVSGDGREAERTAAAKLLRQHFIHGWEPLPGDLLPLIAERVFPSAVVMLDMAAAFQDVSILDSVVDQWERIASATPPEDVDRAAALSNLGKALSMRAGRTDDLASLDRAVLVTTAAVHVAERRTRPSEDLAGFLANLGLIRIVRSWRTGDRADLAQGIGRLEQAAEAAPEDDPVRTRARINLCVALRTSFERTGSEADLDRAIRFGRDAVRACPDDGAERALALHALGGALHARYLCTGDTGDANDSVGALRASAAALAEDDPHRATASHALGAALVSRFFGTGDRNDLEQAVEATGAAVMATPGDHPDLPVFLNGLARAHLARYRAGDGGGLDRAVLAMRRTVSSVPDDHAMLPTHRALLAEALHARFTHGGDPEDLDEAVEEFRAATSEGFDETPDGARVLLELGGALDDRWRLTGRPADREAARVAFERAWKPESAPPTLRISAALAVAETTTDPVRASEVLDAAVRLLVRAAPRSLRRGDQQSTLERFPGLAARAAAAALNAPGGTSTDRAVRALGALETGRGILIGQALDVRGELSDLWRDHPALAERFVRLRDALDGTAFGAFDPSSRTLAAEPALAAVAGGPGAADAGRTARAWAQSAVRDRRELTRELDSLIERIRDETGLTGFGLPPGLDELLAEAGRGPVVVLTAAPRRCDALLLTESGVRHLPLPALTHRELADRVDRARAVTAPGRESDDDTEAQEVLSDTLAWLWDVAAGPVLEALGLTDEAAQDPPRIWWVTGGLLGRLPLHAAGHHTDTADGPPRTVMDRAVSSTAPSVRALRHAREREEAAALGEGGHALVVAMPGVPGLAGAPLLQHVEEEAAKVVGHLPGAVVLGADGTPVSSDAVLRALPDCAVAHFACHGAGHPEDPSLSRLVLADDASSPLTVARLGTVGLDRARLAYLSACETAAVQVPDLLDESIHVSTAFQLAGFPHVVGTLWAIDDEVSVVIADEFYARLREDGGGPDPARAARALHGAIRAVRDGAGLPPELAGWDRTAAPMLWAAHLHIGA
ncbi:CHAT domain-containing protein [Nocardiopsis lambiniae]|uniref:CHAT domain-containing protein n=1 Tax=Nocardiopsis lambiniae TaxID=3075539 RepID=A0ABU2M6H3_9ACTN|nr:CHAT domain-containing protein [Nocardiopsis sp. DSM 44743]MDT0328237.1 CHAT domain-containing protein [Nocardiopsis sp. DSM 44743]